MPMDEVLEALQVARWRFGDIHRLQHHRSKLAGMLLEEQLDGIEIAVRCEMRQRGYRRRYAEISRRGTDVPVLPPVVAEQYQPVAFCGRARKPNRCRCRVSSVLAEAHHLGTGDVLHQPLGKL